MQISSAYPRALAVITEIVRGIESIVVPNGCAFCGGSLPVRDPPVCGPCYDELPWTNPRFHLDPFAVTVTPLEYSFPVDAAIKRLKYRRKLFYVPALCHLLRPALVELPDDVDALLPMPLHWRRQGVRGFNQAYEIARGILRVLELPVISNVARRRHTPYQTGLTARQRRRNLDNAFLVKGCVRFRHVLVVDDVITTGESCRELARVVLDAGAEKVSALAIARAVQD